MPRTRMIVPPLRSFFKHFSPKNYCTPHNSVTVWDIVMKLYSPHDVSHTIMIAFALIWPIDLVLCLFLSCTLHISLTVHDIFMQFYGDVY